MSIVPKRRWFRFSLRRLIVVTAMACMYFACWGPTKTTGVDDVERRYTRADNFSGTLANATPVLPLLIRVTVTHHQGGKGSRPFFSAKDSAYCFWFFGLVAESSHLGGATRIKVQLPIKVQSRSRESTE